MRTYKNTVDEIVRMEKESISLNELRVVESIDDDRIQDQESEYVEEESISWKHLLKSQIRMIVIACFICACIIIALWIADIVNCESEIHLSMNIAIIFSLSYPITLYVFEWIIGCCFKIKNTITNSWIFSICSLMNTLLGTLR